MFVPHNFAPNSNCEFLKLFSEAEGRKWKKVFPWKSGQKLTSPYAVNIPVRSRSQWRLDRFSWNFACWFYENRKGSPGSPNFEFPFWGKIVGVQSYPKFPKIPNNEIRQKWLYWTKNRHSGVFDHGDFIFEKIFKIGGTPGGHLDPRGVKNPNFPTLPKMLAKW